MELFASHESRCSLASVVVGYLSGPRGRNSEALLLLYVEGEPVWSWLGVMHILCFVSGGENV